jgi:hypothetical protein
MTADAARPHSRALTPAMAACWLVTVCLGLAALTLLAPSAPSYDPFAWIVWGRELMPGAGGEPFGLAGGPSWKPLPVLFTTPFSLAGDAAPALWLLVARAGLLLALAGAFALGTRLSGRAAGLLAALLVLLLDGLVSLAWRGASEPLLLAATLWAGERHLAGARCTAFALGVAAALIRPEVVPFLALYAAWLWRDADARERALLVAGLALVPLLWIGLPGLAGDPFAAGATAQTDVGAQTRPLTALHRGLELPVLGVWLLALACSQVAPRGRERAIDVLLLGACGWVALIVAMTAAGFAGVARYMLPAAAVASVLAAVAAVELLSRAERVRALLALMAAGSLVLAGALVEQGTTLPEQLREGTAVARSNEQLRTAVDAAGGPAALRRCALGGGWVAVNHTAQSALAWELRVNLDRVARTMSRPGLLVGAPRSAAAGAPPTVALTQPRRSVPWARAGAWSVVAVSAPSAPVPRACSSRKASGPARRIPNI